MRGEKPTLSMHGSRSVTSSRLRASVARRSGTNKPRMTLWKAYGLDTDSNLPLSIRLLSRDGRAQHQPTATLGHRNEDIETYKSRTSFKTGNPGRRQTKVHLGREEMLAFGHHT